eukprot:4813773-Amphidinium_carterae.1
MPLQWFENFRMYHVCGSLGELEVSQGCHHFTQCHPLDFLFTVTLTTHGLVAVEFHEVCTQVSVGRPQLLHPVLSPSLLKLRSRASVLGTFPTDSAGVDHAALHRVVKTCA